jgi:hypothetical protein
MESVALQSLARRRRSARVRWRFARTEPHWPIISLRLNLSRWRHGFEPRWDYERKPPGQGTSSKSSGSSNRDSNAEYPENIPSQIVRSRS